jgi:hypothetical protein
MNTLVNPIAFVVGVTLAPLAAIMAYIITYQEYQHHYPDSGTPRRMALQTAVYTFVFFVILSLAAGWVLGMMLR